MDSRKCQTVTATPAKPGELPVGLDIPSGFDTWGRSETRPERNLLAKSDHWGDDGLASPMGHQWS